MNSLNSILIEGECVADPELSVNDVRTKCEFTVQSFRMDSQEGKTVSSFEVEAYANLATSVAHNVKAGRGLRIVGRIKQVTTIGADGSKASSVKIVAEHVEFQPRRMEA
jgi:single-strand DNA-binding protein